MTAMVHPPKRMGTRHLLKEVGTVRSLLRLARRRPMGRAISERSGTVMTLPGFGFNDAAMSVIRTNLRQAGYNALPWKQGFNFGNVPALIQRLVNRVLELEQACGEPICLVGWSLGGYIAREVAREIPGSVAHVITLGSPIKGGPKYTVAAGFYQARGVDLDALEAVIAERASTPLSVPVTCIYSKRDGVVDWRAAVDLDNPLTTNIEVDCSHLAMGLDPDVIALAIHALVKAANDRSAASQ